MPVNRQTVASAASLPVYTAVSAKSGSRPLGAAAAQAVHTIGSPTQTNKSSLGEYALAAAMDPQVQQLALHAAKQTYSNVSGRIAQRKAQRQSRKRTGTEQAAAE